MIDAARVFIYDAADRIENEARRAWPPCRRRHAAHATGRAAALPQARAGGHHRAAPPRGRAAVQSQDRYPFEGR